MAAPLGDLSIQGTGREVWSALVMHSNGRIEKPSPGTLPFCGSRDEVVSRIADRAAQDPDFLAAHHADTGRFFLPVRLDKAFRLHPVKGPVE